MGGANKLSPDEVKAVISCIRKSKSKYRLRDLCLFMIGISTGFRVSEILKIRICDVMMCKNKLICNPPTVLESIKITRSGLKGGKRENSAISSREVYLNDFCREDILQYVLAWKTIYGENPLIEKPLFQSRKKAVVRVRTTNPCYQDFVTSDKAISRIQANEILGEYFREAGIKKVNNGSYASHSMRKTFAWNMFELLGRDLLKTQRAMGHLNLNSTVSYLDVNKEEIDMKATKLLSFLEKERIALKHEEKIVETSEIPDWA